MHSVANDQAPSILVNTELAIDEDIGVFSKELAKLETAVKTMHSVANDQAAKYRGDMKKDCRDIGKGFKQLAVATGGRVNCLDKIGAAYEDLGSDWESQATRDWEPMVHTMHDYRGLSEGWDKILGLYSSVREKGKEIIDQGGEKEKDAADKRWRRISTTDVRASWWSRSNSTGKWPTSLRPFTGTAGMVRGVSQCHPLHPKLQLLLQHYQLLPAGTHWRQ